MKIIGYMDIRETVEMVLSADSAMLVNRKPYFLPDTSSDVVYYPSVVVRISRLGKSIAPRFAYRYYDAIAMGADFVCRDLLEQAIDGGHSWTEAIAGDGSLGIGEWMSSDQSIEGELVISIDEAIARASRVMTIRQGDLLYIHRKADAIPAIRGERTDTGNAIR